jgi:hypothetical protein
MHYEILEQRTQSQAYLMIAGLTNEARVETKLVWAMPCKEEKDLGQSRQDST